MQRRNETKRKAWREEGRDVSSGEGLQVGTLSRGGCKCRAEQRRQEWGGGAYRDQRSGTREMAQEVKLLAMKAPGIHFKKPDGVA